MLVRPIQFAECPCLVDHVCRRTVVSAHLHRYLGSIVVIFGLKHLLVEHTDKQSYPIYPPITMIMMEGKMSEMDLLGPINTVLFTHIRRKKISILT